jgi:hypothetical protein
VSLVIKGSDEQVKKAIDHIEQSKGARLPRLRLSKSTEVDIAATRKLRGKLPDIGFFSPGKCSREFLSA